ncbi:DEKNAAC100650 [Brettanomyces naardenensis]|uniref:DEKNAAC100650 n=1 Tax=Brettanomyces naardenensis TaxID=13370 RepID=A0A448YF12_BRENA|nr:DEKNAAC100650 [Brettanomyces naardenensis]
MTEQIPLSLVPPIKFSKIEPTLFRGAYPRPINYRYLSTLKLRTMVALVPYAITNQTDPSLVSFCESNDIQLIHIETDKDAKDKGKKRSIPIDHDQVLRVLELILDKRNNPVFIFCSNGGQISSLVVACLRKLQFWSSVSIYNEFTNFSTTINHNDRTFIENFRAKLKLPSASRRVDWIWNGISANVIEKHPHLQFAYFSDDTTEDGAKNIPQKN